MNDNHLDSDLLIDFVHGELSPQADALAHAHLAACDLCRESYNAEIAFGEALRADAAEHELEFPSTIKAAIWEEIRNAKPSPAARFSAWLRPALGVPALAVLALGFWFVGAGHGTPAPTVDANYYLQAHLQSNESPLSEPPSTRILETSMLDGTGDPSSPSLDAVDSVAYTGMVTPATVIDAMR